MELDPAAAQELARLKSVVLRDGGVTVAPTELRLLCSDSLSVSDQFMAIASIARKEGWSFAFLPDGAVRFGSYAKN
jgi:hypothetical protein